jgi:hypothetical protein
MNRKRLCAGKRINIYCICYSTCIVIVVFLIGGNGTLILIGIVLGLCVVVGFRVVVFGLVVGLGVVGFFVVVGRGVVTGLVRVGNGFLIGPADGLGMATPLKSTAAAFAKGESLGKQQHRPGVGA